MPKKTRRSRRNGRRRRNMAITAASIQTGALKAESITTAPVLPAPDAPLSQVLGFLRVQCDMLASDGDSFEDVLLALPVEDTETIPDLANGLLAVRRARQRLSTIERLLEGTLAATMPANYWFVDGVGRLTRKKRGKNTKWDHEALTRELLDACWDEIGHPTDVVSLLMECASIGYWRLQALDRRGVNGYKHREQEDAGFAVLVEEGADQ